TYPAAPEIYTLSLHDALPISLFQRRQSDRRRVAPIGLRALPRRPGLLGAEIFVSVVHQGIEPALGSCPGETVCGDPLFQRSPNRSEEHTSELQSRGHLVCRLL